MSDNIKKIESVLEAVLFTMGESVSVDRLAAAIQHDEDTTRKIMHQMMDHYNEEQRGMKIIELENAFQLCTRPEMYLQMFCLKHCQSSHTNNQLQKLKLKKSVG